MRNRLALLAMIAILISAGMVNAQERAARKPGAKVRRLNVAQAVAETRRGNSTASPEVLVRVIEGYDDPKRDNFDPRRDILDVPQLTGTWYVTVPLDETTAFNAFHTFGSDGTFVETSSLLGTLIEGPAHGVWEYRKGGAVLTFEVFEFDPDGNHIGRVRVRNFIRLLDGDHFTGDSVVDFIELNGEVIEGIATATYTAERMKIRGL